MSLKKWLPIAGLVAATAAFLNYGTVSPCAILHQEVRAKLIRVLDSHNQSSPDRALFNGVQSGLIGAFSDLIDAMIDQALVRNMGSAGPAQCFIALAEGWPDEKQWSELTEKNQKHWSELFDNNLATEKVDQRPRGMEGTQ